MTNPLPSVIIMEEQKDPTTGRNLDPFWKCLNCGNTVQIPAPPEICPSCEQKCAFKDVTCYTPDCGGPGNQTRGGNPSPPARVTDLEGDGP